MKSSRVVAWAVAGVLLATAIGAAVATSHARLTTKSDDIPLSVVRRGEVDLQVHANGELRASHAIMLAAPAIGGDSLQITKLTQTGISVKKGDVIIEFDPSEQRYKLEQSRSELLQAEQEITKATADALVQAAEDKVNLLKARYNVRRDELDVQKHELVSKIDADKNQLALEQAKRALAELEKDLESHKDSGQASIYLAREKSNKAKLAMDEAQQNLEKMRVLAPMDGLVSIQKNMNASGGFFFTGMSLPDYHPGDQAQPGSPIAQVVDPSEMNLVASIGERERGYIRQGQTVTVNFDALPDHPFHGTVKSVGGMAMRQIFVDANAGGTFDASIQITDMDARLRPGLTAQILFLGDHKKNVLYLPRQALFMKDGKRIVYVSKDGGYEQREIKIQSENESRAAIEGLAEGTKVALVDPTVPRKVTGTSAAGSIAGAP